MKYRVVQKTNPANLNGEKKWYANLVNHGTINKEILTNNITKRTELDANSVSRVLDALLDELPSLLFNGYSVNLENFGTLRFSSSGKGSQTQEDYSPEMIERIRVIFTPSVEIKNKLKNTSFERID